MNVVGLGRCGCNIAKCFEQYPQYNVYHINTEKIDSKNFFLLKKQDSHEEYEKNYSNLSKFFKKIKDEVFFIVGGSGTISGATLSVLEDLKHCKITVVYVKPETDLLSENKTLQEKVVYNVLQQYARSGLLKVMYVFSNPIIEEMIPDITIYNRFEKINKLISSSLHMMNVFNNTEPVTATITDFSEIARIGSAGSFDVEENLENFYFSLDNVCEKCYYYAVPEKQLKEDTKLFRKITEQMKNKAKDKKVKISYMIHSTDYPQIHCYVVARSSQVQK